MPTRRDYPHQTRITTRWMDNDAYQHVNNVVYLSFFDTVINEYLLKAGVLDPAHGSLIGVCAESHCKYLSEISFPDVIEACLRVEHLGTTSVRYGIALFVHGREHAAAEGWFVHVFVDRLTRRPFPLTQSLRTALGALQPLQAQVAE